MKLSHWMVLGSLIVTGIPAAQAQSWVTDQLALYYPFNGNVQDASGHGYNPAINVATPAPDRFGNPTNAMAFNGVNSGLVVPGFFYDAAPNGTPLTESIWFCPSNSLTTTNLFTLVANGNSSSAAYGLSLYSVGAGLQAYEWALMNGSYDDGSAAATASQTNFSANVWHHVVGVFTDSSIQIYLDGTLQGSASLSALFQEVYPDLNIGAQEWNNGSGYRFGFQGRLDDVRIYTRALSATEVGQLYTLESPAPTLSLASGVVPTYSNLLIGASYQLQVSGTPSGGFTNYGEAFTATDTSMSYPGCFLVDRASALYFRLQRQ